MFDIILALSLPIIVGLIAVAYMLYLSGAFDSYYEENRE